jgi:hypothetical protein
MSRFIIVRHQALHVGGTKFYQQVKIEDKKGGKAFLIQHWGPWKNNWDLADFQTKVLKSTNVFSADLEYRDKIRNKQGRGYETKDVSNFHPDTLEQLREVMRLTVGASEEQVGAIVSHFGGWGSDSPSIPLEVVTAGVGVGGDVPTTEGWGSW